MSSLQTSLNITMVKVLYFILILTLGLITNSNAARILVVVPTASVSHQVVFHPLTQELAKRGHEVVFITTDPAFPDGKAPANLTEIDLHDFSYNAWKEIYETSSGNKNDIINQLTMLVDLCAKLFVKQMATEKVQKIIQNKNESFDLLILEAWLRPTLVLSHLYKVPVIQVSSLGMTFDNGATIGAPWHPFLYPISLQQRLYNLTIWEKLGELYNYFTLMYMYHNHEKEENEMIRNMFGPDVPTLSELKKNVHMLFLNSHPIWEGNMPVPPTVVHMGGIHQKKETELPKDLKSYLDSSTHGVIYISFGTNVHPSSLPREKIQIIIKVLSQLPYDILWKWDKDEMPGRSNNIKISKWFPQSDLLRHPKVKLFITQGGLQSTDEAITAGVPLIGIPMFTDQWYNVEKYVHHKIGLRLDMETLTQEKLNNAINTVIKDKSYQKNIIRLRALMSDQPQSSLDRAVWWIEHLLRHGGASHYHSPAANMSWTQYLELELVLILSLGFVLISVSLVVFIYYSLKVLMNRLQCHIKIKKID